MELVALRQCVRSSKVREEPSVSDGQDSDESISVMDEAAMIDAKLILAAGSHAGVEERLKSGYYMIGRHSECQIRPKSRSVSRRHCLLHRTRRKLTAYDLGSTQGTSVNDHPLEPNQWLELSDGDMLRCGKVVFRVAIDRSDECRPRHKNGRSNQDGQSVRHVDGWKDFDIVKFLESEDEAERREMYGDAPRHHLSESLSTTAVDLEGQDPHVKAVLDEARRRKRTDEQSDEDEADIRSARARRIAELRAKIEAERQNIERQYEIESQLQKMINKRM